MALQVKGTVDTVFPTEQVSSSFSKRVFWMNIEEDSKYPQKIQLEFTQAKCVELDKIKPGMKVEVDFNIRGNEYKGKVYVNLQAWKIAVVGGSAKAEVVDEINSGDQDSLPF